MKIFVGCSSSNDIPNKYKEDCKELLSKIFENQDDLVFGACNSGIMGVAYNNALSNDTTKSVSQRKNCLIGESDVFYHEQLNQFCHSILKVKINYFVSDSKEEIIHILMTLKKKIRVWF